jgi:glycerol-3-phosphate dehydrogenase
MIRHNFKDNKEYDMIVIGGGITGASVAYEAASRGLSVALLERHDYGSKTSAATSMEGCVISPIWNLDLYVNL